MNVLEEIYIQPMYQQSIEKINQLEKERIFCGHNLEHFKEVARIGCLWNKRLEKPFDEALIIGFAFLHDIGRWCEYETGESHEQASVRLAKDLLEATSYTQEAQALILEAIAHHREVTTDKKGFGELMYKADKASRACYNCKVQDQCYWPDEKKNLDCEAWMNENR